MGQNTPKHAKPVFFPKLLPNLMASKPKPLMCPDCGKQTTANGGRRFIEKIGLLVYRRVCEVGHNSGWDGSTGYSLGSTRARIEVKGPAGKSGARETVSEDGKTRMVRFE